MKDGRYGPYCSDGTTNASLPKGTVIEEFTLAQAARLLEERREAAPAKKKPTKKAAAKKASPTKKAAAKKRA
jgi:DNA topoisomerase-1